MSHIMKVHDLSEDEAKGVFNTSNPKEKPFARVGDGDGDERVVEDSEEGDGSRESSEGEGEPMEGVEGASSSASVPRSEPAALQQPAASSASNAQPSQTEGTHTYQGKQYTESEWQAAQMLIAMSRSTGPFFNPSTIEDLQDLGTYHPPTQAVAPAHSTAQPNASSSSSSRTRAPAKLASQPESKSSKRKRNTSNDDENDAEEEKGIDNSLAQLATNTNKPSSTASKQRKRQTQNQSQVKAKEKAKQKPPLNKNPNPNQSQSKTKSKTKQLTPNSNASAISTSNLPRSR